MYFSYKHAVFADSNNKMYDATIKLSWEKYAFLKQITYSSKNK